MINKRLFLVIPTALLFLLLSKNNIDAYVLGKPEPGEHDKCKISCATPDECSSRPDDCSLCYFCPNWNYGGPICHSDCKALMGPNLETVGLACMELKCTGCVECNPNPVIEHETIVDECKNGGELSLECYIASVNRTWLNDAASTVIGNYSDQVNSHGPSVFKGINTMIGYMYKNPPASGAEYLADLSTSFGLARPAYAQGVGFTAMQAILPAWKAARNVAYIFFIIAFLVSGFAIMFRMKISPQTVISIQNALPKMIITLILVTFSYAIAGLLIDLSYVLLYLAILAFGQTGWIDVAKEQTKLTNLNFWGGWGMIYGGTVKAMFTSVGAMFDSMASGGPVVGGLLGGVLATILGVLGALIFWIVALVLMFKLFFSLITCYVQVIMLIFIGPLLIAFDALPNGKNGFKSWLNKLMGNIMVFPGVAFMMLIGWEFTSKKNIADWNPPLFGDRSDLAGPIFGFGILMLTAKMPEIIKGIFKIKDEGYGTAIGQAVFNPAVQGVGDRMASTMQASGTLAPFGRFGRGLMDIYADAASKVGGIKTRP